MMVHSKKNMRELLQRALNYTEYNNTALCKVLYRNKDPDYFDDILTENNGYMKPYIKDNSGDAECPMNGRIDGLFFMATTRNLESGKPLRCSAFGSERFSIPVENLVKLWDGSRLYFSDFYCMGGKYHYVSLVLVDNDSDCRDKRFVKSKLIPLCLSNSDGRNPFFHYDHFNGAFRVLFREKLMVEILYVGEIDLYKELRNGGTLEQGIPIIGKGSSTPGGKPKPESCTICNINGVDHLEDMLSGFHF